MLGSWANSGQFRPVWPTSGWLGQICTQRHNGVDGLGDKAPRVSSRGARRRGGYHEGRCQSSHSLILASIFWSPSPLGGFSFAHGSPWAYWTRWHPPAPTEKARRRDEKQPPAQGSPQHNTGRTRCFTHSTLVGRAGEMVAKDGAATRTTSIRLIGPWTDVPKTLPAKSPHTPEALSECFPRAGGQTRPRLAKLGPE